MYWYLMGKEKREACGRSGRNWSIGAGGLNSRNMGEQFITGMDYVFKNWTKPKRFGLYSVKNYVGNTMSGGHMGFEIPKIDKDALLNKIEKVVV